MEAYTALFIVCLLWGIVSFVTFSVGERHGYVKAVRDMHQGYRRTKLGKDDDGCKWTGC